MQPAIAGKKTEEGSRTPSLPPLIDNSFVQNPSHCAGGPRPSAPYLHPSNGCQPLRGSGASLPARQMGGKATNTHRDLIRALPSCVVWSDRRRRSGLAPSAAVQAGWAACWGCAAVPYARSLHPGWCHAAGPAYGPAIPGHYPHAAAAATDAGSTNPGYGACSSCGCSPAVAAPVGWSAGHPHAGNCACSPAAASGRAGAVTAD
jgi:hypothetical protein